jgi:epoxide hydrolase-like predicted phosphatase
MKRIRLYIFDMGGVVSINSTFVQSIAAHLGMSVADFFTVAGTDPYLLMTGELSVDQFWQKISQKTGIRIQQDLFSIYFHPVLDKKVVYLAESLKAASRVVAGTNTMSSHYEIHRKLGDYAVFDKVYASHHMGCAKPDPQFYTRITEAEMCSPSETVFIDDLEENVTSARMLGIHSILFSDPEALEESLRALKNG